MRKRGRLWIRKLPGSAAQPLQPGVRRTLAVPGRIRSDTAGRSRNFGFPDFVEKAFLRRWCPNTLNPFEFGYCNICTPFDVNHRCSNLNKPCGRLMASPRNTKKLCSHRFAMRDNIAIVWLLRRMVLTLTYFPNGCTCNRSNGSHDFKVVPWAIVISDTTPRGWERIEVGLPTNSTTNSTASRPASWR